MFSGGEIYSGHRSREKEGGRGGRGAGLAVLRGSMYGRRSGGWMRGVE